MAPHRRPDGGVHATDPSNASRTLLYDIDALRLVRRAAATCSACPRPASPRCCPSSGRFGTTDPSVAAGLAVPVSGIAGDQQSALFGQACFEPGHDEEHVRHRLVRAGEPRVDAPPPVEGLLTTRGVADRRRGRVRARRRDLRDRAPRSSGCATGSASSPTPPRPARSPRACPTPAASSFVPAFTGLGSPYWDPYARGTILGLTRGTGRAHLARAVVEAMAWQTRDVVEAMTAAAGVPIAELRVDGGAA